MCVRTVHTVVTGHIVAKNVPMNSVRCVDFNTTVVTPAEVECVVLGLAE